MPKLQSLRFSLVLLFLSLLSASPSAAHAELAFGPERLLNATTAGDQWQPDAGAARHGNLVVVWISGGVREQPPDVYVRLFAPPGVPLTEEIRVSSREAGRQFAPSVAVAPDGRFVVAWHAVQQNGVPGVFARRFDAAGRPLGERFRVSSRDPAIHRHRPDVAIAPDGSFAVAWTEADGEIDPFVDPFPDPFGIAFTDVYARRFGPDGQPQVEDFGVRRISGYQYDASISMNAAGDLAVAYTDANEDPDTEQLDDINVDVFNAQGIPRVSVQAIPDDTSYRFQWWGQVLLDDDGSFLVVWSDELADAPLGEHGDSWGVRARRFRADGEPLGEAFPVNDTRPGLQLRPAVARTPDGGFLAVWTSDDDQDGSGRGVFARRFDADGAPRSPEIQVNLFVKGNQSQPAVAVDAHGRGLFVWRSARRDGDGFGILGRQVRLDDPPGPRVVPLP